MRHFPFPKISTTSPAGSAADKGTWVAQEKIHGAQLVVGVSATELRIGKRKAWLEESDGFFGWQLYRAELARVARAIREALRVEADRELHVYGELFGGSYPHPAVVAIPGLSPVQTGIWYAPDVRWAPFDAVLVAPGDPASAEFADALELSDAARAAGAPVPPLIARGKKTDVSSVAHRFVTRVPEQLGFPPIEKNFAEGIVIKPAARVKASERAVTKRKIEEFDEAKFGESEKWDPQQVLPLDGLIALGERLVNAPRLQSARSKAGESSDAIVDEVVLDVMIDLGEAFPAAMRLDAEAEERLRTALAGAARRKL